MTTLVIVSIGLSLTQLVTLGWLSRTVTRVRRATADLEYRNQGNHVALEIHERRIDLLVVNHTHLRDRCDSLQRQIDFLEYDTEDAARQQVESETAFERQLRGINGDIDTLFDDVMVQKGGGL